MKSKAIYLDQNKWSDIAKMNLGILERNEIASLTERKLHSGEWLFVYSHITWLETLQLRNRQAVKDELVRILSNVNYLIPNFYNVIKDEIACNQSEPFSDYYTINLIPIPTLLGLDSMRFENDIDCKIKEEFLKDCKSYIVSHYFNDMVEPLSDQQNEEINREMEEGKLQYQLLKKEGKGNFFFVNFFLTLIILCKLHIDRQFTSIAEIESYAMNLPSFKTFVSLVQHLFDNVNGSIHRNDWKDIQFLSVAIPYCDVVIAEKKWVNVIKSIGLDKQFSTIVSSDLNILLDI